MPTPTFNKYKSTTIYGNLSVRDLTNQAGNTVIEVASIDLSGNFLSRGDSTFTKKVICNASVGDINANNVLTTKQYVDNAVSGGSILATNNTFTGENTFTQESLFNGLIKSSGAIDQDFTLPSGNVNKFTYTNFLEDVQFGMSFSQDGTHTNSLDNLTLGTGLSIKGLNLQNNAGITQTGTATNTLHNLTLGNTGLTIKDANNITKITITPSLSTFNCSLDVSGNSTFNSSFPTSTLPTSTSITNNSIVNKGMNDTLYSTITNQVKTNTANAFTSTNSFNSNLPTSTQTPTTSTQLTTKAYVDSISGSSLLSSNNTFTGLNTFNDVDISGNLLRITNATATDGEFRIVDTNNVIQISISPVGFNQIDPTGENSFNGITYIYNDVFVSNASININTGDFEITNGTINQVSGSSFLKNLTADNIAYTSSVILTSTSQDYSSSKTPNYIFHSRTATTASTITLSTDAYIINGQYLYIRRINSGNYTLTINSGSGTSFLLSYGSIGTVSISGTDYVGIQFIYDKPNLRWIRITV